MDALQLPPPLAVVALSVLVVVLSTVTYVLRGINVPALSGPGLCSYLPDGPVYRLYRDPRQFSSVMDELAAKYGSVFAIWLGTSRVIVTSVPADIVHISSSAEFFPRPPKIRNVLSLVAPGGLFSMESSTHRIVRRKLRDSFNHSMLHCFHDHMTEAIADLCASLERVAGTSTVTDISQHLAVTTFMVITNVAFGSNMDRQERLEFADAVNKITEEMMIEYMRFPIRQALARFGSRDRFYGVKRKIFAACNKFIQQRVAETKEEKDARKADMLDAILALDDRPEEAMASLTAEFAMAGSHTTNQMITWSVYETCLNPHVVHRIEKELATRLGDQLASRPLSLEDVESLPYVMGVWKETCRMHPIGSCFSRIATKDVTLKGSGIHVLKGTELHGQTRRCHMNPEIWKEPNTFKPERWGLAAENSEAEHVPAGAYVPFGIGELGCAGRFLADYEGPLILAEMHRRFKFTLGCEPSDVKVFTYFVDTPKYVNKDSGVETGLPVFVELRGSR